MTIILQKKVFQVNTYINIWKHDKQEYACKRQNFWWIGTDKHKECSVYPFQIQSL